MPQSPLIFIAFGVTGELMKNKILPALAKLKQDGSISEQFALVGISRSNSNQVGVIFGENFYSLQGDASEAETYVKLAELLDEIEGRFKQPVQKIFYISTSPALYQTIFKNLSHMAGKSEKAKNIKLMIEKPFGLSGIDADELNSILYESFIEDQIYRIDHYLAKEDLLNLATIISSSNPENKKILGITVSFLETTGVEKRGASYDAVGALRDVGQNHMLEMFAANTGSVNGDRAKKIQELHVLTPEEVSSKTKHTQYQGYLDIQGVQENSQTETYFKIETTWNNRQRDIPIIFEGGKKQMEDKKSVTITYTDGSVQDFPIGSNKGQSEHERLILDCIQGNHALFVSEEETTALWRFIDPVIKSWTNNKN
jgi:glucose-6-phosphate 1-dehydrogenase